MQISLDQPEFQRFVEEQVRTGRFKSPSDVIHGALTLLRAHEELTYEELQNLRGEIAVGVEEADRGEVEPWDAGEIANEVERRFTSEQQK